jgi:putative addiction module component (TIGR02574 family)
VSTTDEVLGTVLQLPADERAKLAHGLLASLDEEHDAHGVDEAWATEIRHRLADVRTGRLELLEWPTVRDELRGETPRWSRSPA